MYVMYCILSLYLASDGILNLIVSIRVLNRCNRSMAHHHSHKYAHSSRRISVLFLFAITAADVVPCGGPKKSPRTSSIVQIVFSVWFFEIREGIFRNQKSIIGLDSFSNRRLIFLTMF